MVENAEVDSLMNVLKSQLRDATTGLYAEKAWARSIEVEMQIIDEWREGRQSFNASDLDGPVWSVEQMAAARQQRP